MLRPLLAVLEENSGSMDLREKVAMQDYITIHDWQLDEQALRDFFSNLESMRKSGVEVAFIPSSNQLDETYTLGYFLRNYEGK